MKSKLILSLTTCLVVISPLYEPAVAQGPARASVSHGIVFLPLDFYSRNGEAIGLDEDQQREVNRILEELREVAPKVTAEISERSRALQEAVVQNSIDMDVALDRFQAVTEAESEMKNLQFKVRMKMRAVLRPEQLEKVKAMVAKAIKTGTASGDLQKQVQQVQEQIQQHFGDSIPPDLVAKLEQLEQQVKKLEQQQEPGRKTFGDSRRTRGEVREQIRRVAQLAEQAQAPELREQLNQAVSKLREAQADENYEVIIEILGAVKKLIQDQE